MSFTICIIGCGSQATKVHGPSYTKYAATHPDTLLAACCDLNEEKAIAFRDSFGFARHYTGIETMLRAEKPAAVCLVAPEPLTCELSCRVFRAGYPLMMEKPPGLTVTEIEQMITAADEMGVPSQVAFNRRYMPLLTTMKRMVKERIAPETIQFLRYDLVRSGRKDPDFSTTAIHGIDTVKHLLDSDYAHIDFEYQEFSHLGPNVANIYLHCRMKSGALAHLEFCPVAGVHVERATLHAEDHTFYLDLPTSRGLDWPGRLRHVERAVVKADISAPELSGSTAEFVLMGFYAENERYFEDIRNGRRPVGDLRSAHQSIAIAEGIRTRAASFTAMASRS